MQAGRLDRRITIQQNVPTFDTYGDEVEVWSDFSTCWANVKVNSNKESFSSDQVIAITTTSFRIRYLSAVNERMRISYNSAFYNIR